MNHIIKTKIDQVSNNLSSVFTKEDVVNLLTNLNNELEKHNAPTFKKQELLDMFKTFMKDKDFSDVVDYDSIEFSLKYDNKIEVDDVPIDDDLIINNAIDVLDECWDDLTNMYQTNDEMD